MQSLSHHGWCAVVKSDLHALRFIGTNYFALLQPLAIPGSPIPPHASVRDVAFLVDRNARDRRGDVFRNRHWRSDLHDFNLSHRPLQTCDNDGINASGATRLGMDRQLPAALSRPLSAKPDARHE